MGVVARNSGGGVDMELELERDDLIPGRLARGVLRLRATKGREIRGAELALIGTEYWKYRVTRSDGKGQTTTHIVRGTDDLPRVPIRLSGPASLTQGLTRSIPFELPVPGLGPPSISADVCGVEWILEAKVDVPGFDPGVVLPVTIHQPTALLRAGVVPVGQFALWPSADAGRDGLRGTISLEPVPLDLGGPIQGRISLDLDSALDLQELRVELRVHASATVSSGLDEQLTVWVGRILEKGRLAAGHHDLSFSGVLPDVALPTTTLPHGRTEARLRVVFAVKWAVDPHLERDVALATTTEV